MEQGEKNSIDFDSFLRRTGMKYSDLSKKANISKPMLSVLKKRTSAPSYETLMKLHSLGMTAGEMFGSDPGSILSEGDCDRIASKVAELLVKKSGSR